jgi:Icc-related predicted phosphoesterase
MKSIVLLFLFLLFLAPVNLIAQVKTTIHGTVFLDKNANGIFDRNEKGVKDVCVSNGKDVVQTSEMGEWKIEKRGSKPVFIIKPSGFAVPVNQIQIPQHFISGKESNPSEFNFPLVPQNESGKFKALFFGDTQARGMKEVNYIFHDVVEELIVSDAAFGVSLGDIVADDPELMDDVAAGIGQIGIPWYNIMGNHDSDRQAKTNDERDETFEKFFGPSTYVFEYGQVVFIGLNNIFFNPDGKYKSHFTEDQLAFVENYLEVVPQNKLVVLMMHSPIVACDNREEMYKIIQNHEHTFSISGHVHEQINLFVDEKMGWKGKTPHHHLINATVCGSWWCGLKDETGIPHATMNDGAPNGYSIITFDGNKYSVQFKAARRPENYQMNIYLPGEIEKTTVDTTSVLVNVFAGSERSVVEMQIDKGNWIKMENFKTIDPEILRMNQLSPFLSKKVNDQPLDEIFGFAMDYPSISHHIWKAKLPDGINTGTHTITIRTTDMYNQTCIANRIFIVN